MSQMKYHLELSINYSKWSQYFSLVKKPNLLQSWFYGDAKKKSQRWKIERGIIYENNEPIALLQVLYKRFLFIKLMRLNLGPLWLIDLPSPDQVHNIFSIIKRKWRLKKLCILLLAPNLDNTSSSKAILSALNFRKRTCKNLTSGLIDLKQAVSDLYIGLRGNWRRRLKTSEQNELSFIVSQKYSDFQWLLSEYAKYQKNKNFRGVPISLLEALRQCMKDFYEIRVGYVLHQDKRVAGMLIAYYGTACTPLVSWLSEKGRELNAGNFILWNFILHSKENGCTWFEQGGIDEVGNADVARFKRGIPCHEYELIGEYFGGI